MEQQPVGRGSVDDLPSLPLLRRQGLRTYDSVPPASLLGVALDNDVTTML